MFFLQSCSKKNYPIEKLDIYYKSGVNSEALFGWYIDKFGERKWMFAKKDTSKIFSINNIFPSFLFLGSNEKIHQPIIINKTDSIHFTKERERHFFRNKQIDDIYQFLEVFERQFGLLHTGDFLGDGVMSRQDIEASKSYYGTKNHLIVKGQKYTYNEQLAFIDSFRLFHNISKTNLALIKSMLKDYYMLQLIGYATNMEEDELQKIKDLQKEIKSFKNKVKNRINYKNGLELLSQRVVYSYNIFLNKKYIGLDNEFNAQWESADKNFKGSSKEFLKFILLKKYLDKNVENYDSYLSNFLSKSKDVDFKNYLIEKNEKRKHPFNNTELKDTLVDTLAQIKTFGNILNKYKGKNIILDFWASWCNPCREEMLEYGNIVKELNNLNTITLFISIDNNTESWLKAIVKTNTSNYEHYLLRKNSPLYNFFSIENVPRYILISDKGQIKTYDAPRPRDKDALLKVIRQ